MPSIVPLHDHSSNGTYRLQPAVDGTTGADLITMKNDILKVHHMYPVHAMAFEKASQRIWDEVRIPFKDPASQRVIDQEGREWRKNAELNLKFLNNSRLFHSFGRDAVLNWYRSNPIKDHAIPSQDDHRFFYAYDTAPPASSIIPWEELDKITLGEMKCHQRHSGRALFCRILTRARVGRGITFAVEDTHGRAIALSIDLPFSKPAFLLEPRLINQLYPIGITLVIREPFIQLNVFTGLPEVCVGLSTDVVEIPPGVWDDDWAYPSPREHPVNSMTTYKDLGNAAFKRKQYLLAIRYYTLGLGCSTGRTPSIEIINLLNRCQAYLDNDMPGSAFRDCLRIDELLNTVTSSDSAYHLTEAQIPKLAWRKLKAAYTLRLFKHAQTLVTDCKRLGVKEAGKIENLLRLRQKEKEGEFDFDRMFETYVRDDARGIDMADYIGPVKVQYFGARKGRGLVLTRNVKAGEVLWVEKAFVATPLTDCMHYDSICQTLEMGPGHDTIATVDYCRGGHKTIDDPSNLLVWKGLYPGETDGQDLPEPIITEFQRLSAIRDGARVIDPKQTTSKRDANAFQIPDHGDITRAQAKFDVFGRIRFGTQLFAIASLCNHSCLANVSSGHIGDMNVEVALYDMPSGTELFTQYCEIDMSYTKRVVALGRWGFKCDCQLCKWDKNDKHLEREQMMAIEWPKLKAELERCEQGFDHPMHHVDMNDLSSFKPGEYRIKGKEPLDEAVKKIEAFMFRLDKTYGKDRRIKFELAQVEGAMAQVSAVRVAKANEYRMLSFSHAGVIFTTPSERAQIGRMVSRIPHRMGSEDLLAQIRSLYLSLCMMSRMNIPIPGYERNSLMKDEAECWKKTAEWMFGVLHPAGGGVKEFTRKYGQGMKDHGWTFKAL